MTHAPLLHRLAIDVTHPPEESARVLANRVADWMVQSDDASVHNTLNLVLAEQSEVESPSVDETAIRHAVLVGTIRRVRENAAFELDKTTIASISASYFSASVGFDGYRSLLLRLLTAAQSPNALSTFADLLVREPPHPRLCLEIFSDLLKLEGENADSMFPRLLDGLEDSELASFVLDYSNYVFRMGKIVPHPATDRVKSLMAVLSQLAERLAQLQDSKPTNDEEARSVGKQVTQAVSLGIPLCDALACIGDPEATACLNKTLQVEHRRLRVEAAAALSKLGVEDAKLLLAAMASDPVERLRVLAYAEELDILEDVDEQYSNIVARAEAEFVTYLSQPDQFGYAPQYVELLDQRDLSWPGYEEPRNCYLFQFVYRLPGGEYTNVGIAGPLVKAVQADLTHLSIEDTYALFAGWHVDHPDILAIPAERTVGRDQQYMERMAVSVRESEEYQAVAPKLLGKLLDRAALIAEAQKCHDTSTSDGWLIVNEDQISWIDSGSPNAPLAAEDLFFLYVGRSLLRSFN